MKVYKKLKINIDTGKVLEEDSFEYSGPVALCSGGGSPSTSTSTVTGDPVYNAGLLKLQEEDAGSAKEYDNYFKYGVMYDPTEKVSGYYDDSGEFVEVPSLSGGGEGAFVEVPGFGEAVNVGGNQSMPRENVVTTTRGEIEGYDPDSTYSGLDYSTDAIASQGRVLGAEEETYLSDMGVKQSGNALTQATNEGALSLVPKLTEFSESGLDVGIAKNDSDLEMIPLRQEKETSDIGVGMSQNATETMRQGFKRDMMPAFYDEAQNFSVEDQVRKAGADAAIAFKNSGTAMRQRAAASGVNPADSAFGTAMSNERLNKTRAVASGMTQARGAAETEKFSRLKTAFSA